MTQTTAPAAPLAAAQLAALHRAAPGLITEDGTPRPVLTHYVSVSSRTLRAIDVTRLVNAATRAGEAITDRTVPGTWLVHVYIAADSADAARARVAELVGTAATVVEVRPAVASPGVIDPRLIAA